MNARGFTLVELMVALVIFAIISAIAIPLYTDYSQRSFRTELMGELLACAQALERFNAINFTYVGAVDNNGDGTADAGASNGAPADDVCGAFSSINAGRYNVNIVTTVDTYTLTATPAGAMAGTGVIDLDETGQRRWDEDAGGFGAGDNDWEES